MVLAKSQTIHLLVNAQNYSGGQEYLIDWSICLVEYAKNQFHAFLVVLLCNHNRRTGKSALVK